jgi:hypothetical protein
VRTGSAGKMASTAAVLAGVRVAQFVLRAASLARGMPWHALASPWHRPGIALASPWHRLKSACRCNRVDGSGGAAGEWFANVRI